MTTHKKVYFPKYNNYIMYPESWKNVYGTRLSPYQNHKNKNGNFYKEYDESNWI